MILVGCDTETTGLDVEKGHKIIEICLDLYKWDGRTLNRMGHGWTQRVNPMRSIDPKAQEVHGISLADLRHEPKWEEVAPTVSKILNKCGILVAHNAAFDVPFIGHQLIDAGLEPPNLEVFCTMENGRDCSPLGEPPSLQRLCWALGVNYDTDAAHSALYDVEVMMECVKRGMDTVFNLPFPSGLPEVA